MEATTATQCESVPGENVTSLDQVFGHTRKWKEIEVYTSIIDEAVRKLHLCARILSAFPLGVCKHCIFHCFTTASTHIT